MSGRSGVSAAMLAQWQALQLRPGHLVEVYFDDEALRMTDLYTSITWGGNTYSAAGHLLSYDGVSENLEMRATQTRVGLSGVDQTWISRVLAKNYLNRRIVIRKCALDAAWQVIVDPVPVFDGLMKKPQIAEDPQSGTCAVLISCSHDASDVHNSSGRRTNHEVQQIYFAGDGLFQYSAQAGQPILWGGGAGQQPATSVAAPAADYWSNWSE